MATLASTTVQHDAIVLRSLLVCALHIISEKPVSQAWYENCSRSVGRHSSPSMVLRHLGLLEPGGGAWRLLTRPQEVRACDTKLAQFMCGWASIMAAIPKAPRTCVQWQRAQKKPGMLRFESLAVQRSVPANHGLETNAQGLPRCRMQSVKLLRK